jgi:hypothetical protein
VTVNVIIIVRIFDLRHFVFYMEEKISGIALGYGLEDRGFESRQRLGILLVTTASRPALGPTHPPIQWVRGALSLGVKRPECEADCTPPSSAEVRNEWSYTSFSQFAFMAWCSVKAQGQLYLLPLPYLLFPLRKGRRLKMHA